MARLSQRNKKGGKAFGVTEATPQPNFHEYYARVQSASGGRIVGGISIRTFRVVSVRRGRYIEPRSSFSPSSRNADLVSSTFCLEIPPSGLTSTLSFNFNPLAAANLDSTLV